MARQVTKKRNQVVLKRDENGKVLYDSEGKPLVAKTVRKSRTGKGRFVEKKSRSGPVRSRQMTPEERDGYPECTRKRRCSVPPVENQTFFQFSRPRPAPVSE